MHRLSFGQCDSMGSGHTFSLLTEVPISGLDFGLEKPGDYGKDGEYKSVRVFRSC